MDIKTFELKGIEGKRVAVVGSRTFSNDLLLNNVLDAYKDKIGLIVSGGAQGADKLGEVWADRRNVPKLIFPADWSTHGKSAGYKRNNLIVENCDICIAFWDGKSKGTLHTVNLCKKLGKKVKVILHENLPF